MVSVDPASAQPIASATLHRLNLLEYENTLRDLLGVEFWGRTWAFDAHVSEIHFAATYGSTTDHLHRIGLPRGNRGTR